MTYDEWLATLLPFEAKALTRREIFQAGAASRDAEVAELKQQIDSIKLATPSLDAIGVLAPPPRTLMENYRKVLQAEHDAEIAEYKHERGQLRAQINMLREALEYCVTQVGELATVPGIASALSSTPEQSLAEYRNKVIEECAKRAEAYAYMSQNFNALAEELRAMKEKL